jgi:glucose/mannose transport system permease protein
MSHVRRERWIGFLIVLPSVILLAIFVYGFIAWTGVVSLSKWNTQQPNYGWAGLSNFIQLFASPGGTSVSRFTTDMWNTFFFTVLFLVVCVGVGLLLAILLDQKVRGEGIFRTIFLFPMALSFAVTGVVWRWIYTPGDPPSRLRGINALLHLVGLDALQWKWSFEPGTIGPFHLALIPVVIAAAWQLIGYTMAMYLAGLRSIPEELREAARVDGASEFAIYRHIIMPILSPITLSALIILGHTSLKIFDLIYAMSGPQGGPANATDVPGNFMFDKTFNGSFYGLGAASSIIMLLMVALVIIPYLIYSFRREREVAL